MHSDQEIRTAIASVIRQVVGDTPKIYASWVLGYEGADWPGAFRIASGAAHGFYITRRGLSQEPVTLHAIDFTASYDVFGMLSYGAGSEDQFSAEWEALAWALRAENVIQVAPDCAVRIGGIQTNFDLFAFGGELCHVAQGTLEVFFRYCE